MEEEKSLEEALQAEHRRCGEYDTPGADRDGACRNCRYTDDAPEWGDYHFEIETSEWICTYGGPVRWVCGSEHCRTDEGDPVEWPCATGAIMHYWGLAELKNGDEE